MNKQDIENLIKNLEFEKKDCHEVREIEINKKLKRLKEQLAILNGSGFLSEEDIKNLPSSQKSVIQENEITEKPIDNGDNMKQDKQKANNINRISANDYFKVMIKHFYEKDETLVSKYTLEEILEFLKIENGYKKLIGMTLIDMGINSVKMKAKTYYFLKLKDKNEN